MSATDYTRYPSLWCNMDYQPLAETAAKKAMRKELENREHICGLIQKAIEDDNEAAANWLREILERQSKKPRHC